MDLIRGGSGASAAQNPQTNPGWLDSIATLDAIDAKSGQENFPVASRLLPAKWRRHLMAIYGFARLVDDVGDEAPGDRSALLDAIDDDLDKVVSDGLPRLTVLRQLAPTVRSCHLPLDPFHRLVEANRRDQTTTRYETYAELLEYCTLSANPVGHLVLGVFGVADSERVARSDAVCTALQLVEHWQDVAEDAGRGRIYLPAEDMRRFGCTAADLIGTVPAGSAPLRTVPAGSAPQAPHGDTAAGTPIARIRSEPGAGPDDQRRAAGRHPVRCREARRGRIRCRWPGRPGCARRGGFRRTARAAAGQAPADRDRHHDPVAAERAVTARGGAGAARYPAAAATEPA